MNSFPTPEQARGILLMRDVMISNNSDAVAIIQAYADGQLVRGVDPGPLFRQALWLAFLEAEKKWNGMKWGSGEVLECLMSAIFGGDDE